VARRLLPPISGDIERFPRPPGPAPPTDLVRRVETIYDNSARTSRARPPLPGSAEGPGDRGLPCAQRIRVKGLRFRRLRAAGSAEGGAPPALDGRRRRWVQDSAETARPVGTARGGPARPERTQGGPPPRVAAADGGGDHGAGFVGRGPGRPRSTAQSVCTPSIRGGQRQSERPAPASAILRPGPPAGAGRADLPEGSA